MLDDNWFSISDEWPEYKGLFVPGSTLYELFIYCLERADCALTYNELLAEDMRGHCKRIEVLPTNIDLSLFRRARRNRERPLVGYVGSYRSETSAFDALASLVSERDDFDVFVMSGSLPKSLQDVPRHRVEFNPYVFSYERYAQIISEVAPDVLLAPAGSTRTDASKCPNKYLEISACGAAGIYSDNLPFNRHVVDGRNGLLVENDLAAWRQGIIRLLEDRELRRRIGSAAAMDVEKHFSTDIVLPRMVRLLTEVSNYHG
jgi:glycosyltransferase involved in cell wall biosynthesis